MSLGAGLYTSHFGLRERPFSLVPDPSFLFWSPAHRRAFAVLEYGIVTHAPITLVTGEIGTGKTTLLRHLLGTLGDDVTVGLVSNAQGERGELLRWVLAALGETADANAPHADLCAGVEMALLRACAGGRRVVLVFDEAQNLPRDSLEELQGLTNLGTAREGAVQLVLFGQPELGDVVQRADMARFVQRVGASVHLGRMDPATVAAYIDHRLAVAGAVRPILSAGAAALIGQSSDGVPRLVNQIADLSLVYAFAECRTEVSRALVGQVLDDGLLLSAGRPAVLPSLPRARRRAG
jgi:general secretion pathway protein A